MFGLELGILHSDNEAALDAINRYIMTTHLQTPKAAKVHDEWVRWFDDLSWLQKTSQGTLDEARNRRTEFNLANALTAEAKKNVLEVAKTGATSEQMLGDSDRRLSTGLFPGVSETLAGKAAPYVLAGTIGALGVIGIMLGKTALLKYLHLK